MPPIPATGDAGCLGVEQLTGLPTSLNGPLVVLLGAPACPPAVCTLAPSRLLLLDLLLQTLLLLLLVWLQFALLLA